MTDNYWIKRADRRIADVHKVTDGTIADITKAYDEAVKALDRDIERLFLRYVNDNGLTADEALRYLNSRISADELDEIREGIDFIEDGEIRSELKRQLSASLYRARISRLEALKEDIYIKVSRMADVELKRSTARYTEIIKEEYLRNVFDCQQYLGFAYSFSRIPEKVVEQLVRENWSDRHYSRRIWGNAKTTAGNIEKTVMQLLLKGSLTGYNSRKLAAELSKATNVSKYACERLIRTESTYFTAMADLEAAKQRGTQRVQFVATLDNRTSEQCREHDGSIINVGDAAPGINIPPLHPFCRSVIIDVIEGLEHKVRRARDPVTGKNILVPASMTYNDWKEKYADSGILDDGMQNTVVDMDYINSPSYAAKFDNLTGSSVADEKLLELSRDILKANSGTRTEELFYIDKKTGEVIGHSIGKKNGGRVSADRKTLRQLKTVKDDVITLHNHPSGRSFSIDDISTSSKYNCISDDIVVGHGGYVYKASRLPYSEDIRKWYNQNKSEAEAKTSKEEVAHVMMSLISVLFGGKYERR